MRLTFCGWTFSVLGKAQLCGVALTAIMLDVLAIAEIPGKEWQIANNGSLFIWVTLWGTNFLWIKQLYQVFSKRAGNLRQPFLKKTRPYP
jgi:hypothetical protein